MNIGYRSQKKCSPSYLFSWHTCGIRHIVVNMCVGMSQYSIYTLWIIWTVTQIYFNMDIQSTLCSIAKNILAEAYC